MFTFTTAEKTPKEKQIEDGKNIPAYFQKNTFHKNYTWTVGLGIRINRLIYVAELIAQKYFYEI